MLVKQFFTLLKGLPILKLLGTMTTASESHLGKLVKNIAVLREEEFLTDVILTAGKCETESLNP